MRSQSAASLLQDSNATWYSCYKCAHKQPRPKDCARVLSNATLVAACEAEPWAHRSLQWRPPLLSLYAAQLVWWLRFFPPERFLVLPTAKLRETKTSLQVRWPRALFGQCHGIV